mmetsp:Transcript_9824/g.28233  ORF Transcript_9824/g.28233 Transcript_9824/m.28233 type:complete len:104 (+) Transcript_9824:308-619(+)
MNALAHRQASGSDLAGKLPFALLLMEHGLRGHDVVVDRALAQGACGCGDGSSEMKGAGARASRAWRTRFEKEHARRGEGSRLAATGKRWGYRGRSVSRCCGGR